MKFLIDADCPRSIGNFLRSLGYEALDIRDINPKASDQEIYQLIKERSLILITRDVDFGNILRYPISPPYGIILLRVYLLSINEITSVIGDLLSRTPERDIVGSLIIARKGHYRIRKI